MLRKILGWAFIAFVIFYVTTDPASAAHATMGVFGWLGSAASSLAKYASHLHR